MDHVFGAEQRQMALNVELEPWNVDESAVTEFKKLLPGTELKDVMYCPCGGRAVRHAVITAKRTSRRGYDSGFKLVSQFWHARGYPFCEPCIFDGSTRIR